MTTIHDGRCTVYLRSDNPLVPSSMGTPNVYLVEMDDEVYLLKGGSYETGLWSQVYRRDAIVSLRVEANVDV
jgi:hypothetical protein